ncbi:MAG: excinuclease ABC subunit UvrC [Chloroflexi bacterium]|nr:excinuclease ABC subunit UvrC [Chloroflexota bacterium]
MAMGTAVESHPLKDRLKAVPNKTGIYVFRDPKGNVLYVGKATSLRSRLRSYFAPSYALSPKTRQMVSKAADFEYILTESEQEALILECNYIKRHRPPYNISLRDDKNFPYLKIDLTEDFPQILITRRVERDSARYFGPYASAGSVRRTLDLLKKLFPYRSCTRVITGKDPRPCLEFYIHRCVGPCIGAASKQEYGDVIRQVILFLEGKTEVVVKGLKHKMDKSSEALDYERAAALRDQIQAIQRVHEGQRVLAVGRGDLDVIALAREKDQAWTEVFFIRQGKLIGRDQFILDGTQDEETPQVLASFVKQFYDSAPYIPPTILLQHPLSEGPLIQSWLQQKRTRPVRIVVPQRGVKRKLVSMVEENAAQGLEQHKARFLADASSLEAALEELREQLSLPRLPSRVECYDISNIQGTNSVGSMVVFEDGRPRPAHYRRFKIKGVREINDYAMMQEVLRRRFHRLGEIRGNTQEPLEPQKTPPDDGTIWGIVPDLVLIDGGKGHLGAALEVFLELGIDFVPLASLAKENEELFVTHASEPIVLPRSSPALHLVQRLRDEAHRFAITYHRKLRSQKSVQSALDTVPGIGPKRKRMLLRRLGSVKGIKEATLEELAVIPGMTRTLAQKVKEFL